MINSFTFEQVNTIFKTGKPVFVACYDNDMFLQLTDIAENDIMYSGEYPIAENNGCTFLLSDKATYTVETNECDCECDCNCDRFIFTEI
jgi:hypothetical protein